MELLRAAYMFAFQVSSASYSSLHQLAAPGVGSDVTDRTDEAPSSVRFKEAGCQGQSGIEREAPLVVEPGPVVLEGQGVYAPPAGMATQESCTMWATFEVYVNFDLSFSGRVGHGPGP